MRFNERFFQIFDQTFVGLLSPHTNFAAHVDWCNTGIYCTLHFSLQWMREYTFFFQFAYMNIQ